MVTELDLLTNIITAGTILLKAVKKKNYYEKKRIK